MKVLKFNEKYKHYSDKSEDENEKILRYKFKRNLSDPYVEIDNTVRVVFSFKGGYEFKDFYNVGKYRPFEKDMETELTNFMEFSREIKHIYIIKKTSQVTTEMSEDVAKEWLEKIQFKKDTEKYNL